MYLAIKQNFYFIPGAPSKAWFNMIIIIFLFHNFTPVSCARNIGFWFHINASHDVQNICNYFTSNYFWWVEKKGTDMYVSSQFDVDSHLTIWHLKLIHTQDPLNLQAGPEAKWSCRPSLNFTSPSSVWTNIIIPTVHTATKTNTQICLSRKPKKKKKEEETILSYFEPCKGLPVIYLLKYHPLGKKQKYIKSECPFLCQSFCC